MQNTVRNILPRNNIIKGTIRLFLSIVNKALFAYAKRLIMTIMFNDLFYFMIC